jgi:hypothetical protein
MTSSPIGERTVKTSSWFTQLPEGHVRIGISRGVPRRQPAGYRRFPRLNPGPWFNDRLHPSEFRHRYRTEILDQLDPHAALAELQAIAGDKVPVLVCYERVGGGQWCHRALVAEWFREEIGLTVPELGYEDLGQAGHPLMAEELRRAI